MARLPKIQLDWWKDPKGYHLAEAGMRVVRNGRGDKLELTRPLDSPDTFRIFATTATTPEGLLRFVQSYGPLTILGNDQGDLVPDIIRRAQIMRDTLKFLSDQSEQRRLREIGANLHLSFFLQAWIDFNPITNSLQWQFRAASLLDGLWLQLGQAVTRGVHIRACAHCADLFEAGLGTGRRLDAKFCSDEHRIAFNSLKRSKEK